MQVDAKALESFTPVLKDLGLTNDQAQKLVDAYAKQVADEARLAQEEHATQVTEWGNQSKGDKEFGGAKFDENLAVAQSAIGRFATPELKALLNSTGLGNHPEVLRFCFRVGQQIAEPGKPMPSGQPGSGKADHAQVLYGGTQPNA